MVCKVALAGALQHGFVAVTFFAGLALLTTFFLKDLPMSSAAKAAEPAPTVDTEEAEQELIVA